MNDNEEMSNGELFLIDTQIRTDALGLAVKSFGKNVPTSEVVERAEVFYKFLCGEAEAPEEETFR